MNKIDYWKKYPLKRMSKQWIEQRKKTVCVGCKQNRYNQGRGYQESEVDAPVNCDHCWHMDSIKYNRKTEIYECPAKR